MKHLSDIDPDVLEEIAVASVRHTRDVNVSTRTAGEGSHPVADSNVVAVHGDWLVRADRASVYAIVSDFERMPEHFPKVARAMRLVDRDGDVLTLEAESASFGSLFPSAKIEMTASLLPGRGYRCTTHNLTFDTTGDEELLLVDDPEGTRINYTYFVTVRHRWLRPLYAWMVSTFALPYWKRSFVDPLESLVEIRRSGAST